MGLLEKGIYASSKKKVRAECSTKSSYGNRCKGKEGTRSLSEFLFMRNFRCALFSITGTGNSYGHIRDGILLAIFSRADANGNDPVWLAGGDQLVQKD